jgi:hypothetical protein
MVKLLISIAHCSLLPRSCLQPQHPAIVNAIGISFEGDEPGEADSPGALLLIQEHMKVSEPGAWATPAGVWAGACGLPGDHLVTTPFCRQGLMCCCPLLSCTSARLGRQ